LRSARDYNASIDLIVSFLLRFTSKNGFAGTPGSCPSSPVDDICSLREKRRSRTRKTRTLPTSRRRHVLNQLRGTACETKCSAARVVPQGFARPAHLTLRCATTSPTPRCPGERFGVVYEITSAAAFHCDLCVGSPSRPYKTDHTEVQDVRVVKYTVTNQR